MATAFPVCWSRVILDEPKLIAGVGTYALEIFEALAHAEARVHGIPLERIHFHEVGAVTSTIASTG